MHRIRLLKRCLALPLALALTLAVSAPPSPGVPPAPVESNPAAVVGTGWDAAACVGCFGGALILAASGWATVLAASMRFGSAGMAAACLYSCYRAIQ